MATASATGMEQLGEYTGFFFFFGAMVLTGMLMILVSHLAQIRVRGEVNDWDKPYECGLKSSGLRLDRYPIHYYLVGILFVLFDVETVFIVPWAVVGQRFKAAGPDFIHFWLWEMVIFLVVLVLGYLFLLQRGVFNWGHSYDE